MSVSPFYHVLGFTVELDARNITQRKSGQEASLVVLPSDETQWDLKFSDTIRLGVPHLCWYVATVYAIKIRHYIFLAMRTIHSIIPFLSLFTLCVQTSSKYAL